MFNQHNSGYSLSDIAAVTGTNNGRNNGTFGDDAWWIIILLLCGWGNGGWGFGGGNGGQTTTREEISYGFDMNGLENGLRGLEHGLCDGFYELNTGLLTGFGNTNMASMQNTNTIMSQLSNMAAQSASCCCETQRLLERGLCEVNYNILTQSNGINNSIANAARDIIENNNNGVRSILDFLTQDKIATLQAENQNLRLSASQQAQNAYLIDQLAAKAPIPAYMVANPYSSYGYGPYGVAGYCSGTCGCN